MSLVTPEQAATALAAGYDWQAAVLALGAVPVEPPRQEPFGAEAWLADPEDNRLLLLVSAGGAIPCILQKVPSSKGHFELLQSLY